MHKLKIESLTVSSFEPAPALVDQADLSEPTHPRCSIGATGCEYCSPAQTQ